jgi:hypothetical protein
MNQTYLVAVPAIGFVQVWFGPTQARFAEKTFDGAVVDPAAKAAHALSERPPDAPLPAVRHEAAGDAARSALPAVRHEAAGDAARSAARTN